MSLDIAEQHVRNGALDEALAALQVAVRDDPSDARKRVFLFQLLCVTGDWKRALVQLNTAAELDNDALLMAQTYRELLQCEAYRADVFAGHRAPLVFGEPPVWIATLLEAVAAASTGQGERARTLIDDTFESAPARCGEIDGQAFEWLADADMRLGPVVEAVIDGKYYWIPFDTVSSIALSKPEDLRDLVWLPAHFTWTNEGTAIGFLPARYPGQSSVETSDRAMGRKTEWTDIGAAFYTGAGQKMLTSDQADYPLLATRKIVFDQAAT